MDSQTPSSLLIVPLRGCSPGRPSGFAALFISHDLAVVDLLADKIAVLHRGRLVEEGTGAEVPDPDEQARRRASWEQLRS